MSVTRSRYHLVSGKGLHGPRACGDVETCTTNDTHLTGSDSGGTSR